MPIHNGCRGTPLASRGFGLLPVLLLLGFAGCVQVQEPAGPFPRFAEFAGEQVREVGFVGELAFSVDSLRAVVQTRPSRCRFIFLPICIPFTSLGREEYPLDLGEVALDVVRLQLYHRDHGFYNARVEPDITAVEEGVAVEFVIDPGRRVVLRDLLIQGADTILEEESVRAAIPMTEGEPFSRVEFLASADTIRLRLLERGFAYADVLRNYAIDTIAGVAEAEFVSIPGPLVLVDTVIVSGNERVSESTLRRQLTFQEGEVLRAVALNDSQRNLYNLDMVSFASIRLASDTVSVGQDRVGATVLVEVVEAAQYAVETSAGFGTLDCFRASGQWVNRNFLGAGRRLQLNGSLSRIGVGDPADLGFGDSNVCTPVGEGGDLPGLEVEDLVDYQLAAAIAQPSVLGTQNSVALTLHSERVSEPDAYVRQSAGGQISAVRQLDRGPMTLTTLLDINRGSTIANPALLCVGFETCTEQDLDLLRDFRWSNSLSVAGTYNRQRVAGQINSGYVVRGAIDWASGVLLSDDSYLRLLAEGSYYRPLQPGWELATNVRFGRFLRSSLDQRDGYIPPERRFYAGGPTSVRGYTRNALGPTTYIQTPDGEIRQAATGGTQLLISAVELRFPSPWLSEVLRLAAFVDAGNVTAPGSGIFESRGIRITPGAGVRFLTPVGPFRMDVAYNPYAREAGPLYRADAFGLVLIDNLYKDEDPSFLGRFRFQFALGQAF